MIGLEKGLRGLEGPWKFWKSYDRSGGVLKGLEES